MACTFPKASYSLISCNRLVGIQGAIVSPATISEPYLGLETHLHHICWLCKSHSHGSGGATRHEPSYNPSTCEHVNVSQIDAAGGCCSRNSDT